MNNCVKVANDTFLLIYRTFKIFYSSDIGM